MRLGDPGLAPGPQEGVPAPARLLLLLPAAALLLLLLLAADGEPGHLAEGGPQHVGGRLLPGGRGGAASLALGPGDERWRGVGKRSEEGGADYHHPSVAFGIILRYPSVSEWVI